MKHQPGKRALFAIVSLALVSACQGATAPIPNGTTFVLESIDGARLPASSGTASAQIVIADTLIFLSEPGEGRGQFEHRETTMSGPYTPEHGYGGAYDRRDGTLGMSWSTCPFFAFCSSYSLISATGWLAAGTLTVTYESGGLYRRTYRRVN